MEEGTEPQEEAVTEVMDQQTEQVAQDVEQGAEHSDEHVGAVEEPQEEKHVPLSALQKERRKRQDLEARANRAEIEAQYLREMHKKQEPQEEDESQYESVTRAEMTKTTTRANEEVMRQVEERIWIKSNSEKKQYVDENLESFLQKKPNLRLAIAESSNRYEEAYTLMEALSPKERRQIAQPVQRKAAPGSPTAVPKAAAMNQAVDVMSMNDTEYREWRQAQRKRR
jgi:hypothetical protein